MPTARKSLFALLGQQFAPMMQGAIGDQEIPSDLRDTLATGLHQAHRF
jgi:hypothetical protein